MKSNLISKRKENSQYQENRVANEKESNTNEW